MKKILIILLVALSLVGCTTKGYSKVTDGDTVIIEGPNKKVTKQEIYESLKSLSSSEYTQDILIKIAENVDIDMDEIDKEIQETIDLYISIGYLNESDVEYARSTLKASAVLEKLAEIYVNDNYDEFVENDKPVKMQMVSFYDEETANKFVEDVKAGKSFEEAASDNGYQYDCPIQIFLDSDETLPLNVKSYLNDTASTGLSTIIIVTNTTTDADGNVQSNDTYYILNIISKNPEDYVEEYKTKKIDSVGEDGVINYMFETHDVKFYDQDIYEIMYQNYEVLK